MHYVTLCMNMGSAGLRSTRALVLMLVALAIGLFRVISQAKLKQLLLVWGRAVP